MITYKILWPELPNIKVPVLHRVDYDYTDNLVEWRRQSLKEWEIRRWCEANCRAAYYFHPGWTNEKFIEFEDDQDAVFFSLRWI